MFFAVDNPSDLLKSPTGGQLPAITGIFREKEAHPPGSAFHFDGQTEIRFLSTKFTLMSLVPGLQEKFDKELRVKLLGQNEAN